MFAWLIGFSLFIVPFIVLKGQEVRELKSSLAFISMLVIGLLALYHGKLKPFKNKFVLILVGYTWLSIMLSPSSGVVLVGIDLMQFWSWKPYCYILVYLLGISAIASYAFKDIEVKNLLLCMVWVATSISVFICLQFFCLDQFFVKSATGMPHPQWNLAGTLGHPTFASSFIGICIPLAILLKQYKHAFIIAGTLLLVRSDVSVGAMVLSLLFLLGMKNKNWGIAVLFLIGALIISIFVFQHHNPNFVIDHSSGRFFQWQKIVYGINEPIRPDKPDCKYPLTGGGLGSFYYTYHVINNCKFFQAHNEPLEFVYNCGLIGVFLFLLSVWYMIKTNLGKSWYRSCLLASFIFIFINSLGMFVFQMGAHCLYTAFIVGLLHNEKELSCLQQN